jgi:hypothetical protein
MNGWLIIGLAYAGFLLVALILGAGAKNADRIADSAYREYVEEQETAGCP